MKTLIMTVGLPQSGKSTWAEAQGLPIVNPDSIRLGLHGQPFIGLAEPFVWAIAKVMIRSLFIAGHSRVILDATNTTKTRREEWKSTDWNREFQLFEVDAETCKERAKKSATDSDHRDGLFAAIDRMNGQMEPISKEEEMGRTM